MNQTHFETINIAGVLENIRSSSPLIHHITNTVTINDCANITLALGGSPVMADSPEEAGEMASFAGALVINMGTLHPSAISSMIKAGTRAREIGKPVVFDPVGAGATQFRQSTAKEILRNVRPTIIKGNAAEIKFLAGEVSNQRGVDSLDSNADQAALALARSSGSIVAATGAIDTVTDGKLLYKISGGSPMLSRITGTGCMTSSLVGCFSSVMASPLFAAILGVLTMKLAGEKAQIALKPGQGSGQFRINLFDAISLLTPSDYVWEERITYVTL
ncbi:hydroxyethylthiazole kinase [Gracilinema caldarium]|uniref:Hydroxyethylthiazole kinase n=1 Tax=Gracilinema caldarium (strain ATCC 51460 / DSM 7334 / H1) TaxID=744872 RepID=F8EWV3_GRAC1|nr:hydroxyethylthiazole kinase [Gracilinema caldarium]AEJ18339.1 Hydroxyethylthiazole kinase [Gracilinema caldarium DSM 7334]